MNVRTLESRFSVNRFGLIVRNRLLDDAPAFATTAAAVFALSLLFLFLRSQVSLHGPGAWPVLIAIGGVLLAGRAFERMHNGAGGTEWLLLPASNEEKYVAAIAVYFVVYPIVATLSAVLISALLALIALVLGYGSVGVWNPLASLHPRESIDYVLFASFALAGSARFRKIALIKTAAFSIGWIVFLGFTGMALLYFFVAESHEALAIRGRFFMDGNIDLPAWKTSVLEIVAAVMKGVAFASSLLYGYFRVAEKEAVDEVQ